MALLKFFHLFFLFLWMSGLITLSGLMAYQKSQSDELTRLARKTYFWAELPSMCVALACGALLLLLKPTIDWKASWLHLKLTAVFFLILCDVANGYYIVKQGARFWKYALHYVTIMLLAVVLVAIYILK